MNQMIKILVIEDEKNILNFISSVQIGRASCRERV